MTGRAAPTSRVARFVGVLAILVGILLLQGSMCDGPTATAAPCVAAEPTTEPTDLPDDHSGLMTLCLTVIMAVLLVLAWAHRPGPTVPTPPSTVVSPLISLLARAVRREQLCVQRQ